MDNKKFNYVNNLTDIKVANDWYNDQSFIYAKPYPIHPIAFTIQDQDHLQQICSFSNSFLNTLSIFKNLDFETISYAIEDIAQINATRHAFSLRLNQHYNKSDLEAATQYFIDCLDSACFDTFTVHIINTGCNEPEFYAFITMYNFY